MPFPDPGAYTGERDQTLNQNRCEASIGPLSSIHDRSSLALTVAFVLPENPCDVDRLLRPALARLVMLFERFDDRQLALEALCMELDGVPRLCFEATCGIARHDPGTLSVTISMLQGTDAASELEPLLREDATPLPLSQVVRIVSVFVTPSWFLYLLGTTLFLAEEFEIDPIPGVRVIMELPATEADQPLVEASAREVGALFDIASSMGLDALTAVAFASESGTGPSAALLCDALEAAEGAMEFQDEDSLVEPDLVGATAGLLRSLSSSEEFCVRQLFEHLASKLTASGY